MDITKILSDRGSDFLNPTPITRETGKKSLGVDDFLKLLSVQFTSQDPLKPMEDTQFISQMASFTSLEQMQTLSQDFAAFSKSQSVSTASSYLGKQVTVTDSSARDRSSL
jgi:flagellar basal-body rod modification protein FlgD